ncbi:MAG: lysophospholipid acyltransferase family protein [Bacteroidales bacterium]|nr:lysophospholipid acyltransferase family protein [Candidatus Cacconaster merdequi]
MKKTKIINKSDIMKAVGMKGPLGWIVASLAMWLLGLNKVNKLNSRFHDYKGPEFSEQIIKAVGVKYDLNSKDFDNIPQDGPFITISNHHIGSLDGMILNSVIGSMRPDFKILTNFLLTMIPSLKENFIPVNPFENSFASHSSLKGLRFAKEHLENGGCLGLFPAGEVAAYQYPKKKTALKRHIVEDPFWPESMIKMIRNANVPVIPIYFEAYNSKLFYLLARIHPMLRTARLVREMFNKKGQVIPMRIGKPILPNEIEEYSDNEQLGAYLRSRVYAMEYEFNNSNEKLIAPPESVVPIALPKDKKAIYKEMMKLKACGKQLFETASFRCYLASYEDIPNTIFELGRRREEAFRDTGEGCNKDIDLDDSDKYYKHLILWDFKHKKIAGAYRLGIGSEIFEKHGGVNGFYTSTLFKYSPTFAKDYLPDTIELGRSFVSLEYQKEALPLMLLLKGLMYSVMKYPDAKYLIGPVSISNSYPKFLQSLMVYFINNKHSVTDIEKAAYPTTPFTPDYLHINPKDLLRKKMDNIEKFDRFLLRLSLGQYRLPTLVKKYIKINARIICFNVDPLFNYSLDGLILLKLSDYPKFEVLSMTKDITNIPEREAILNRFGYSLKEPDQNRSLQKDCTSKCV